MRVAITRGAVFASSLVNSLTLATIGCAIGSESALDASGEDSIDAAQLDAAPSSPDACVDATINLLANGDFEGGTNG